MKIRTLAFSFAALALSPLSPAATLQLLPDMPEDQVFLRTPALGSGGTTIGYNSSANRWAGFSFSPDSDVSLGQISVYLSSRSNALGAKAFFVQVVSLTSLSAAPDLSDPGTILASERGWFPVEGLPDTQFAYLAIDLETPISLSAGGYYGVLLGFVPEEGNTTNGISLRHATSAGSMRDGIGGSFYTEDQGGSYTLSSTSYSFALAAPIPEPGTVALLGMLAPGLALGYLVRRRK